MKIKTFLKKYWLFIFLASLATVLVFLYINSDSSQNKKTDLKSDSLPKPETIERTKTDLKINVSQFIDESIFNKKEANVYQVTKKPLTQEQAINIAKIFGFQEQPTVLTDENNQIIYNWYLDNSGLVIILNKGVIDYGVDLLTNPQLTQGQLPDIKEAESQFIEFLKKNYFYNNTDIDLIIENQGYAKVNKSYFEQTTIDDIEKELIYFKFSYQIDGIKISDSQSNENIIYIGSESKIFKLILNKPFDQLEILKTYPLKTKEELVALIKSEPKISFIKDKSGSLEENIPIDFIIDDLESINFNEIELIYLQENKQQIYLQPVYLVTGEVLLKNGFKYEAGLYLPAIKDEYFFQE